jgi:hypothetical protein
MLTTSSILSRVLDHHDLHGVRVVDTQDAASFESIDKAARALGLETRAGRLRSYDALVRVEVLPAIVSVRKPIANRTFALREHDALEDIGRTWSLELVHGADATGVDLEHPESGRYRMPRAEFEAAWRGAILCFAGAPRRPGLVRRIRRTRLPPAVVVAAAALFAGGVGVWLGSAAVAVALGVAVLASTSASLSSDGCAACQQARGRLGMSLGPVGIAGYGALFAAVMFVGPALPLVAVLCAAAGFHIALVIQLASTRLRCVPCLVTALAAWLGAGAGLAVAPIAIAIVPIAAVAGHRALTRVTRRARTSLHGVVRGILSERHDASAVTMVVYKADGCAACKQVETEVLPGLVDRLGDRLRIETRPMHPLLPAPTIVVYGTRGSVALLGSPDPIELDEALAA